MDIKIKLVMSVFFIFAFASSVTAYEISTSWKESVIIENINGAHIITKDGNLESKIWMKFRIDPNYFINHKDLTIYFYPCKVLT